MKVVRNTQTGEYIKITGEDPDGNVLWKRVRGQDKASRLPAGDARLLAAIMPRGEWVAVPVGRGFVEAK